MKTSERSVIWASAKFTAGRTQQANATNSGEPYEVSLFSVIKYIVAIRFLLNDEKYELAREKIYYLNNASHSGTPVALIAVIAELQVALEINDGNFSKAVSLYENLIIPAYNGMPRMIGSRAEKSLEAVKNYLRKSA